MGKGPLSLVRDGDCPAAVRSGPPLRLLRQAKLTSLLAAVAPDLSRLEASGVVLQNGVLWVIFDNLPHVAAIHPDLVPGPSTAFLVRQSGPAPGYEDIALDDASGRRLMLIEGSRTHRGNVKAQVDEYDGSWHRVHRRWVELDLEDPNKGLEGLTCVHRNGRRYLLALSEGNGNHAGRAGRHPGHGLIHVLEERDDAWHVLEQIRLPPDLPFTDYSSLSVHGDRIAVVSQESSALWVGRLDPQRWRVADTGQIHRFPRDPLGRPLYGTVEGITWLDEQTVAVVSDRAKPGQPHRFQVTAESVHVFEFPARRGQRIDWLHSAKIRRRPPGR